jgi:hypothetical protein
MKKMIGILGLIGGIVLLIISFYIKHQIEEGKAQISSAQEKVDQGTGLFSVTPQTKAVGNVFTGAAQNKINEGKGQISHYEEVASWLQIGGIVLVILGVGVVFLGRKKSAH